MSEHTVKVAHLTYDMRIGGTEQVILNIVKGKFAQAIEHHIVCIEAPLGPFAEQLQASGVCIHSLVRRDGFDINLIKSLRKLITAQQFDILHCHQYTPWSYGTLAAIGLNTKVIFTEHGRFYPDVASSKRRFINPILMHFTDKATAISAATKTALVEYEYLEAVDIEVVYNGISPVTQTCEQCPFAKDNDTIVFGTIARFDLIKNHPLMIEAFAEYQKSQPNALLVLVGDGETAPELTALAQSLNVDSKVIFTGYQLDTEAYLQHFDVFLLTSFSEGTSMTLLNAMQYRKPSIVTRVGGNPEIIQHEHSGLVIENDDRTQLINAMQILSNQQLAKEYGENAHAAFHQMFSEQHMNMAYSQIYVNLTEQKYYDQKVKS